MSKAESGRGEDVLDARIHAGVVDVALLARRQQLKVVGGETISVQHDRKPIAVRDFLIQRANYLAGLLQHIVMKTVCESPQACSLIEKE